MKETINNNAYLKSCDCPECARHMTRGYAEKIVFCSYCGAKLHQRAFSEEEINKAIDDHLFDNYED